MPVDMSILSSSLSVSPAQGAGPRSSGRQRVKLPPSDPVRETGTDGSRVTRARRFTDGRRIVAATSLKCERETLARPLGSCGVAAATKLELDG
jgi:hypothetical protein